jgi:arsenite oxidase small subunit
MSKMSRRSFLKSSSVAVAIPVMGTTGTVLAKENSPTNTGTTLDYPETAVGNAHQLPINKPVNFNYPDSRSPCALIRMGQAVPGGMGPDQDVVAYSILCNHMGCPLNYDPESRTFKCPCHFSIFDSEKAGQMVIGQATEDLPRILLSYNKDTGDIKAVGVSGLIFGRQANIL